MEYVTSWEERGVEKGRVEGMRETLLVILTTRFGVLDPALVSRIQSPHELKELLQNALTASSLHELGLASVTTS
ncbi:MAG: hypothetical protein HY820_36325 [Acidobacteria bacterium]|nr:hypothetical protein [Acidobacteriota bacterium]